MAPLVQAPEHTASLIASALARLGSVGPEGDAARAWLVRRTLEEMGFHCEEDSPLQDLQGFLIASAHGPEIVLAATLTPTQQLAVYVHLLATAVLHRWDGEFAAQFAYVEGRAPKPRSERERREQAVASALARAILDGDLGRAPRYIYQTADAWPKPPLIRRWRRWALRLMVGAIHRVSLLLYWYSPRYQQLRAHPRWVRLAKRLSARSAT